MPVVCIDLQSLAIVNRYPGDAPNQTSWGGPMGDPSAVLHLATDLDPDDVMAVRADDATIQLVADPVKVQAKTAQAWTALRTQRNRLLQQSDWVALADAHLSQDKKDAWFTYRQALRDLPDELANTVPEGAGPPDLFDWPLDPTVVVQAPVTGSRLTGILGQV